MKTWLSKKDIERITKVLEGNLPEVCVSDDELEEIERLATEIFHRRYYNAPVTEQ